MSDESSRQLQRLDDAIGRYDSVVKEYDAEAAQCERNFLRYGVTEPSILNRIGREAERAILELADAYNAIPQDDSMQDRLYFINGLKEAIGQCRKVSAGTLAVNNSVLPAVEEPAQSVQRMEFPAIDVPMRMDVWRPGRAQISWLDLDNLRYGSLVEGAVQDLEAALDKYQQTCQIRAEAFEDYIRMPRFHEREKKYQESHGAALAALELALQKNTDISRDVYSRMRKIGDIGEQLAAAFSALQSQMQAARAWLSTRRGAPAEGEALPDYAPPQHAQARAGHRPPIKGHGPSRMT